MKLELKHIAPYLPYELKVQYTGIINGKEKSEYNKTKPKTDDNIFSLEETDWERNFPKDILGLRINPIKKVAFCKERVVLEVGIKNLGLKRLILSKFYNDDFKPILRPLTDLADEIKEGEDFKYLGYFSCTHAFSMDNKSVGILAMPFYIVDKLFKNHFDVFGLIEKGLAIDINTLK